MGGSRGPEADRHRRPRCAAEARGSLGAAGAERDPQAAPAPETVGQGAGELGGQRPRAARAGTGMTRSTRRIDLTPGYLLHHRPWRDTSRILEVLTREHGRLTLFARGVRGPGAKLAPVLQPFQLLLLSWSGRGEAPQLTGAERAQHDPALPRECLLAAFYLNELLIRLTTRHDPLPELFDHYHGTLTELRAGAPLEPALRIFEQRLLEVLGYGLDLAAEALYDDKGNKGNRNEIAGKHIVGVSDDFLTDGSTRTFVPLAWKTWRFLQLDIATANEPLQMDRLRSWFTAFPFEQRGRFDSDDSSLAPIWEIGWRTARLDAHDTYMDTPYWERLQYVGDTRIQALISYTVAGDDRLARQAIQAINDSRIPDGITQSRYPSSLPQYIPTFSLLWVGMVHDFWLYRNDTDFVRAQLGGTRAVLDWFLRHQRPDGLLQKLPWWVFVDWSEDFQAGEPPQDADGGSSIITLQFIEALRYASELENTYGHRARAEMYRQAADRGSDAIRKLCWNQKYGLLADTPAQTHFSQHANILGIWLDVIPQAQQKTVLAKLLSGSIT